MSEKMEKKRGNLSLEERQFISDNTNLKSVEWIARQINRSPENVLKHIQFIKAQENAKQEQSTQRAYKYELSTRKYWPEIQKQFTETELALFEDHYCRFLEQFKGDVLASEELQIIDLIRYEILINRNMREQSHSVLDIERLEKKLGELQVQSTTNPETEKEMKQFEALLIMAKGASKNKVEELVKMQGEKNKLFKELKATRAERVHIIEDGKVTIFGLFKMLDDYNNRAREARRSELFKLSKDKEKERLSKPFKYEDGEVDIPLLTSSTVCMDWDEEKEDKDDGAEDSNTRKSNKSN